MKRVRVLVADDSPTMRAALSELLSAAGLDVVGAAEDGHEAVALAKSLLPDVITMDVQMPGLDGWGAIREIMTEAPCRILVVSAVGKESQQDLSFRAVAAGALEIVPKPTVTRVADLRQWGDKLAASIRLMAEVPVVQHRRAQREPLPSPVTETGAEAIEALGVVASTGGPPVVADLLSRLPARLPFAVLVAQHITPGFTSGLARWFQSVCPHPVEIATPAEAARAGRIYLARDGEHLALGPAGLFTSQPSEGGFCPSGDRLLASLARAHGRRAAGLVLTGMGEDGAAGLLEIHRAGGPAAAQSEASCVVFGMPRAAIENGAASVALSPTGLSSWIESLATRGAMRRK